MRWLRPNSECCKVYTDDQGEVGDAENKPHIYKLEIGGAGKGTAGLRVQGDEHQQGCKAHGSSLIEVFIWKQQSSVPAGERRGLSLRRFSVCAL